MVKSYKLLMLLLLATFTLGFTACTDDGDDENDVITVEVEYGEWYYMTQNAKVRYFGATDIATEGSFFRYVGQYDSLKKVKNAPSYIGAHTQKFYDGGCYVVLLKDGGYLKFRVVNNPEDETFTLQYQAFTPQNIED